MTARRLVGVLLMAAALPAAAQSAYRWVDEKGRVQYSDQPPPQSVKSFEERKLQANRAAATQQQPYALRKAAADFPVVLYVGKDCGQACDDARGLLKKRGIPFSENLLQTDAEVASFKSRFGKEPIVPSMTIGRELVAGFGADTWNAAFDRVGYPSGKP